MIYKVLVGEGVVYSGGSESEAQKIFDHSMHKSIANIGDEAGKSVRMTCDGIECRTYRSLVENPRMRRNGQRYPLHPNPAAKVKPKSLRESDKAVREEAKKLRDAKKQVVTEAREHRKKISEVQKQVNADLVKETLKRKLEKKQKELDKLIASLRAAGWFQGNEVKKNPSHTDVSKEIAKAFLAGKKKVLSNTETDGEVILLHGTPIVKKMRGGIYINAALASSGGKISKTTKERLNSFANVVVKGGILMCNDKPWNGNWHKVADL